VATFPLHRPLTLLAMLGAVVLLVLTWSKVVSTISNPRAVAPKAQPSAIVWADRVFASPASLRRWLHSRGMTYGVWSRHHPRQAAILEHRPLPQPAKTKPKPAEPVASPPPRATSATRGSGVRDVVLTLLLLVALVLAAAAALPAPLRRRFPALAFRVAHYRGAIAAAAAAIVLGIAVSVGLS
jgi:hypothetical protein